MTVVLVVRPDQVSRIAEIGELSALAYLSDGLLDSSDPFVPRLRDAKARAEGAILLMAATGDKGQGAAVGTLTVVPPASSFSEFKGEAFELRMLAVSPLARSKGIGEALARFGLDLAVSQGAKRVLLSTMETMTAAHGLYEKLGFVPTPELDWVTHPASAKTKCDDACLRPDGTCSEGGYRLLAFAWTPRA